jgi:hypothetical protein
MASYAKNEILLNNQARIELKKGLDIAKNFERVPVEVKGEPSHDGWRLKDDIKLDLPTPKIE